MYLRRYSPRSCTIGTTSAMNSGRLSSTTSSITLNPSIVPVANQFSNVSATVPGDPTMVR